MLEDLLKPTSEFTPRDAFLIAFDDAIAAAVQSLTEIGLEDRSIWSAFSEALELFHKTAVDVGRGSAGRAEAQFTLFEDTPSADQMKSARVSN
jgi:hypothetical protein